MNNQAIEKQVLDDPGVKLAINSIFHTIQGEGPFAGSPSVFVRLAGCNLQCPLCDTEYTQRQELHINSILHAVRTAAPEGSTNPRLVVITGGEPFRQSITKLVYLLLQNGFHVQIETNGTLFQPLPFGIDTLTIVCSPKAGRLNKQLAPHINAFKYVATAGSLEDSVDGLPSTALDHPNAKGLARPPQGFEGSVYLQPVDEKNELYNRAHQDAVVNSCLKYGHTLCLQMHKIVGLE